MDQRYTAERVQAEMNGVAQNYLKVASIGVALYYLLRSVAYLVKLPPETAPYLVSGALGAVAVCTVFFLLCRREHLKPLYVESMTISVGLLLVFNIFFNMYFTGNKNQLLSAGLAIIVFGLITAQLRVWIVLVGVCVTCFVISLFYLPDVGVDAFAVLGACTIISVGAFLSRAPAIRHRVELQLQLEDKAQSLEDAIKAKDRFLANMTHELRTPLTGVLGMMDLLRDTRLTKEQKQLLKTAKTSAGYLLAIISDILDYSKLESGKFELVVGPMDAVAMTRDIAGMLRGQAEAKGISVTVHVPEQKELWVEADSVRLGQVLFNLLGNAIKFTDKGGADIYLEIKQEAEAARLTWRVCDTGSGIPKERISNLFERFEQLGDDNTRRQTGTGLGLAIIKELIELMDGDIDVKSELGAGSEFRVTVTLPRAKKVLREASVQSAGDGLAALGPLKVLVAEDNLINQLLVCKLLEQRGWDITVVENGEDAVAAATETGGVFDLVLMDVRMPVMDGPTATRLIKEKMKAPPPVVALTANTMKADVESYLKAGMDACVGKPIIIDELLETIQAVLKPDGANGSH